jgi:N-acetylneuraminic acid mutarotase
MHLRFASLVICTAAFTLVACSSSDTNNNTGADTGSTEEDTFVELDTATDDTSEDSSATDSSTDDTGSSGETSTDADVDTGPVTCSTPGATEARDCGKCGTQARLCNSDGTWLPWGLCTSETGVCVPGETRSVTCGKCGTRTETCTTTCAWDPTACTGEGLCNAGDMEIQYGACSNATYVKTRTCSTTTCAWSDWTGCVPPKGWVDIATTSAAGRDFHTAVWSGTEMIIWGGYNGSVLADGAAYKLSDNSWRTLPASGLAARRYHTAVWTGTKMIVWGGVTSTSTSSTYATNSGAVYDVATDSWTPMSTTNAPSARYYHTAVWTGTKMIVWGGYTGSYAADGHAYDPATNTWSSVPIATAPIVGRQQHNAEFVNGKMIVYGGSNGSYLADAAAYDPSADSWATLSPPSGDLDARYAAMSAVDPTKKMVGFFGGYGNSYVSYSYIKGTGGIFDTVAGTWKSIPQAADSVFPYPRRYYGTTWWAPDGFYVWGGSAVYGTSSSSNTYSGNGAVFDPTTSTWRAMSDTNAPVGRQYPTAVWTGAEAIIWGGYNGSVSPYYRNDGKIYRP